MQTSAGTAKTIFKVELNGAKLGDLPDEVINSLNNDQSCYAVTPHGKYIFTKGWQLAVLPVEPNNTPLFVSGKMTNNSINEDTPFSVLWTFHVGTVLIEPIELDNYKFNVDTANAELKVRRIFSI